MKAQAMQPHDPERAAAVAAAEPGLPVRPRCLPLRGLPLERGMRAWRAGVEAGRVLRGAKFLAEVTPPLDGQVTWTFTVILRSAFGGMAGLYRSWPAARSQLYRAVPGGAGRLALAEDVIYHRFAARGEVRAYLEGARISADECPERDVD